MELRVCKGRDAEIKLDPQHIRRMIEHRSRSLGEGNSMGLNKDYIRSCSIAGVRSILVDKLRRYVDEKYPTLTARTKMECVGLVVDMSMGRALREISDRTYREGMKTVVTALNNERRSMKLIEGYPEVEAFVHRHGIAALAERLRADDVPQDVDREKATQAPRGSLKSSLELAIRPA